MEISSEQRRTMVIKLIEALRESPSFCNMPINQIRDAVLSSELQTFQQSKSLDEYMYYMNEKLKKVKQTMGQKYEYRQDGNHYQEKTPDRSMHYEQNMRVDPRDQQRAQPVQKSMYGYHGVNMNQPNFNPNSVNQGGMFHPGMMQNGVPPSPNSTIYSSVQPGFGNHIPRQRELEKQMRGDYNPPPSPRVNGSPTMMQGNTISPRLRADYPAQPSPIFMRQQQANYGNQRQANGMQYQGFETKDQQRPYQNKSYIGNVNSRAFPEQMANNQKFKGGYNDEVKNADDVKRTMDEYKRNFEENKKRDAYMNYMIETGKDSKQVENSEKKRPDIPINIGEDFFKKDLFASESTGSNSKGFAREGGFTEMNTSFITRNGNTFDKGSDFTFDQFIKKDQASDNRFKKASTNEFEDKDSKNLIKNKDVSPDDKNESQKDDTGLVKDSKAFQDQQRFDINSQKGRINNDSPLPDFQKGEDFHNFLNSDVKIEFEAPKDDLDSSTRIPERLSIFLKENGLSIRNIFNMKEWRSRLGDARRLLQNTKKMDPQTLNLRKMIAFQDEFFEYPFLDLSYFDEISRTYGPEFDYSVYFERAVNGFQDRKSKAIGYSLDLSSEECEHVDNKS